MKKPGRILSMGLALAMATSAFVGTTASAVGEVNSTNQQMAQFGTDGDMTYNAYYTLESATGLKEYRSVKSPVTNSAAADKCESVTVYADKDKTQQIESIEAGKDIYIEVERAPQQIASYTVSGAQLSIDIPLRGVGLKTTAKDFAAFLPLELIKRDSAPDPNGTTSEKLLFKGTALGNIALSKTDQIQNYIVLNLKETEINASCMKYTGSTVNFVQPDKKLIFDENLYFDVIPDKDYIFEGGMPPSSLGLVALNDAGEVLEGISNAIACGPKGLDGLYTYKVTYTEDILNQVIALGGSSFTLADPGTILVEETPETVKIDTRTTGVKFTAVTPSGVEMNITPNVTDVPVGSVVTVENDDIVGAPPFMCAVVGEITTFANRNDELKFFVPDSDVPTSGDVTIDVTVERKNSEDFVAKDGQDIEIHTDLDGDTYGRVSDLQEVEVTLHPNFPLQYLRFDSNEIGSVLDIQGGDTIHYSVDKYRVTEDGELILNILISGITAGNDVTLTVNNDYIEAKNITYSPATIYDKQDAFLNYELYSGGSIDPANYLIAGEQASIVPTSVGDYYIEISCGSSQFIKLDGSFFVNQLPLRPEVIKIFARSEDSKRFIENLRPEASKNENNGYIQVTTEAVYPGKTVQMSVIPNEGNTIIGVPEISYTTVTDQTAYVDVERNYSILQGWQFVVPEDIKADTTIKVSAAFKANGWYWNDKVQKWEYWKDSEQAKGWLQDAGQWYYLDLDTGYMISNVWKDKIPGWEGKWFYFDQSGVMAGGWRNNISGWEGKWFYFDQSGVMAEGWKNNIPGWEGKWFYFGVDGANEGVMYENKWVNHTDGYWYYLGSNGVMLTNARTPDGFWVGPDGKWIPGA